MSNTPQGEVIEGNAADDALMMIRVEIKPLTRGELSDNKARDLDTIRGINNE